MRKFLKGAKKLSVQDMIDYVVTNGLDQTDSKYAIYDNSYADCDYFRLATVKGSQLIDQLTIYAEFDDQEKISDSTFYALAIIKE